MNQIFGGFTDWGWIALKAALLYVTAVFGFRLTERRTLAEMSAFDFVAAVAVGAIVGRVPNATTTSYMQGAVTLITILIAHRIIARLRRFPAMARLFDHPPSILISQGQIIEPHLRRSGLTHADLFGILRQHGVLELHEVYLLIFEQRGKISILKRDDIREPQPELVRNIAATQSSPV